MADEKETPTPTAGEPESLEDVANLLDEMVADVDDKGEETPPADKPEDKGEEEETPAPPTTPDLSAVFRQPEGQRYMREQFQSWLNDLTDSQRQSAEAQEVQRLMDEKQYEELGKRWATTEANRKVKDEALEGFLDQTYRGIFADPAFQNLKPEEVQALRPENFRSDAEYIRHLSQFIATKNRESGLEETVKTRVDEGIQARINAAKAKKLGKGAIGGAPPADAKTPDKPTDSRTLIQQGLRETFKDVIEANA